MAPIKFEENIKDKLEHRSLSPSPEAWSKLSERLDAEDKKSKFPFFWWLSIAAGLVLLVAVSIEYFGSDNDESVMPTLVQEKEEELKITPKPTIKNVESIQLVNQEDLKKVENSEAHKTEQINKPQIIDYKKVTQKAPKSKAQVAEASKVNITKSETENEISTNEKLIINNDELLKTTVVDALNTLKTKNNTVTDREVDSLLKLASKELFKDKLKKETSKTVDANALLNSVQDEMGQSFRSKVFDALKDSYETVKTAVAERNN